MWLRSFTQLPWLSSCSTQMIFMTRHKIFFLPTPRRKAENKVLFFIIRNIHFWMRLVFLPQGDSYPRPGCSVIMITFTHKVLALHISLHTKLCQRNSKHFFQQNSLRSHYCLVIWSFSALLLCGVSVMTHGCNMCFVYIFNSKYGRCSWIIRTVLSYLWYQDNINIYFFDIRVIIKKHP